MVRLIIAILPKVVGGVPVTAQFDPFQSTNSGANGNNILKRADGDIGNVFIFDRACSVVVIALRFGTQGPGFEPGLFHKACYMPLHGY
jgi:hypothetical protein